MIKISGLQVGRDVHYVLPNFPTWIVPGRHVAAFITRVRSREGNVNLAIFPDAQDFRFVEGQEGFLGWMVDVPYDPDGKLPGTWHFLEAED